MKFIRKLKCLSIILFMFCFALSANAESEDLFDEQMETIGANSLFESLNDEQKEIAMAELEKAGEELCQK